MQLHSTKSFLGFQTTLVYVFVYLFTFNEGFIWFMARYVFKHTSLFIQDYLLTLHRENGINSALFVETHFD